MSSPALRLENVDKFYGAIGRGVHAVRDLCMEVERGEIVALLGSSGCGKTSTLRMIAGFEETSRGRILVAGREVQTLPPARRGVAMAFEGYSLYPTVDVRDNIAFALKASRFSPRETKRRVEEVAEMLEIDGILDRMPNSLSGGQQQRASLARALVRDADLHLLDEPMGQLEPQLRTILRGRVKRFAKERGMTAILVTHDQTEANALADRIALMEDGMLQQYAAPAEIRNRPANLFAGTFMGEPPMNVFPAAVSALDGLLRMEIDGEADLHWPESDFAPEARSAMLNRGNVMVGVRPRAIRQADDGAEAQVLANQWLGDQSHIAIRFAATTLVLVEHARTDLEEGDAIRVRFDPTDLQVFDPATGAAIVREKEKV